MKFHVVHPSELEQSDIAAWGSMQSSQPAFANPFLSPEFVIAVGRFRQGTRVAVLSEGSSSVGFFPFERLPLGRGVPAGPLLSECQGLIHVPGLQWDAAKLLRACQLSTWNFDHLVEGQLSFERYCASTLPSPIIDLTGGFGSYYEKLRTQSSQFCSNVERKARKLEREVGSLRFVPDSDDHAAFRALQAWKSAQYRRNGIIDLFALPCVSDMVETLFNTRSDQFAGLLSVLYAGDVPVAAHFGLRGGDILGHWFPAYDSALSKYSPGLILHMRMAEFLPSAGVRVIDMGTGPERYKQELKNGDFFVGAGTATTGTPRSAALLTAQRLRVAYERWARNAERNTALDQAVARLGKSKIMQKVGASLGISWGS
jgi:CelD/BcsL family acetyltransferase involved in cellulose biosynthesis